MEMDGMKCNGCGSTNVVFDAKRRILVCNQCGKEEYYSRHQLNTNGKVVFARQNATQFFRDGKMEDARHYSLEVLNISMDNAPALYMLAYYDEFTARKPDSMKGFFENIKSVALEYEEVREIKELLLASAYNLADFEEQVVELIALNMQAAEDATELCEFVDALCPYLIGRRTSAAFLTDKLAGMYHDLAEHCGIPKTCFALIKGIDTNPDSPYSDNSFYLKAKARYFYDNYVTRLKAIVEDMQEGEMKKKFLGAYQSKCQKYKEDAQIV